jgi:hypothetical protein
MLAMTPAVWASSLRGCLEEPNFARPGSRRKAVFGVFDERSVRLSCACMASGRAFDPVADQMAPFLDAFIRSSRRGFSSKRPFEPIR